MSDALLVIEDYSGGFRSEAGDLMPVLHGVSYRLKAGVMTAVVGESGSGKSLVALSILGLTGGLYLLGDALADITDPRRRR